MTLMRSLSLIVFFVLTATAGSPVDPGEARELADSLYAEGSYRAALELYRKLPGDPHVRLRVADCSWRDWAATSNRDQTQLEQARDALREMLAGVVRVEDRDRIWAEAQESLGDSFWIPQQMRNWHQAWGHYQYALQWWAGSTELELARGRYLDIIRKAALPPDTGRWFYFGQYGNQLPLPTLERALSIAGTPDDRALLNYQMAMTLRYQGGDWRQLRRVPELFQRAIAEGHGTRWRDDAIFQYAQWLDHTGPVTLDDDGVASNRPDYVEAVRRYRQLVAEFQEGDSRWFRQAEQAIRQIVEPQLNVAVSNAFLPDGEIGYALTSRNVGRIELSLTAIDLSGSLFPGRRGPEHEWLPGLDLPAADRVAAWTVTRPDHRDHRPSMEPLVLDRQLPAGAYVLEARAGRGVSRALVLVTDLALVIKTSGDRAIVYAADAHDGSPVAGATVHLWQLGQQQNVRHVDAGSRTTDQDGLAEFDLPWDGYQILAGVRSGERQALATSGSYRTGRQDESWHVYTFSDRPAYRPGETARFKVVARAKDDGVYRTPVGEVLEYTIRDARWNELTQGRLTLNDFGSAWAELELDPEWTLGEFRIEFRVVAGNIGAGQFPLFRLEEYKLPEFTVSVATPVDDEGRRKVFVLGDVIEADVLAEYTFGGAVAGASVEVLVHQSTHWRGWSPPRPYGWLYEKQQDYGRHWGGGEQAVHRETLTTDAGGRATVRFQTPFGQSEDFQYRIEARVTDASRREILGQSTLRVGRRSYTATMTPQHNLYRPGDKVTVEIFTRDANEEPVSVEGKVTVVRQRWTQRGDRPGAYEEDDVFRTEATTNAEGEASIDFETPAEGYYRVRWFSRDRDGAPVRGETTVWVCDESSRRIGYHHGGVELLVDRDSARAGETMPVMISIPVSDRWVLFSIEAEGILEHRMIHVEDRVKLVELEIDDRHVPNVFLSAAMIHDLQLWMDHEELVVPPVKHFLDVSLEYDRERYRPRQDGEVTVVTRDVDGNPVSAEVALALVDSSVFYIQQDYSGDPRKVYFGQRRAAGVQTGGSLQTLPFRRPAEEPEDEADDRSQEGSSRGDLDQTESFADAVGARSEVKRMAAAPMAKNVAMEESALGQSPFQNSPEPGVDVHVRTDFRSTVLWLPDLVTDENGRATVDVTFPESLTRWSLKARVATTESAFGIAEAEAKTHQPVILRLQNPRFLVVGDEATISGVVRNESETSLDFDATLDAEGVKIVGRAARSFELAPGEERRLDWTVVARDSGTARLTASTTAGKFGDAMQRELPVLEHGIDKQIARAARLAAGSGALTLGLPAERRSTSMFVQVTPSLAVTMLDALPYLIDYPYGCTEQTMSRFLPAAIVARTLEDLGLDADEALSKLYGGIEQEHLGKTHPDDKGGKRVKLGKATRAGLKRLDDLQHGDGGWGWWKEGESDAWMTAYVVWGLAIARDAGIDVKDDTIGRGVEFLRKRLVEFETSLDMQSFMLFAVSSADSRGPGKPESAALDNLWDARERINAYTRALFALSAHSFGQAERAETLVRNLANGVKVDDDPANSKVLRGAGSSRSAHDVTTAHWGADGFWWRWSQGPVETTAFVLRAMLAVDPGNELIPQATDWLIQNRRGAQWSNTRDTAIALLALTDYLKASGEIRGRHGYTVAVNGRVVDRVTLEGAELIAAPSRFEIDPAWLKDGDNTIEVTRTTGEGPLYVTAQANFFSLEEPVTAAGHQLFVRRQYNRIVARETLLEGPREQKTPLVDGGRIDSGDRVEVVLTVETKNDYEYLLFEDLKPAGFEAVEVRSGGPLHARELKPSQVDLRLSGGVDRVDLTGATRWVYRELRDRKVALFVDRLPQGVWEIRYTLRAETPGTFHAMPFTGHAMYVPEIRANGVEQRVTVRD